MRFRIRSAWIPITVAMLIGAAGVSTAAVDTDTDGDGILDVRDICLLVKNPLQTDTNGDNFGNACDADLNNDGIVNFADLALMKRVFFTSDPDADLNGDGVVNFGDLAILKAAFFKPPGPGAIWPVYRDPQLSDLSFRFPPPDTTAEIQAATTPAGTRILIYALSEPATAIEHAQFSVLVLENPDHLSLEDWFAENVDQNQILVSSGAFVVRRLGSGADAYVRVTPVPEAYAELYGPVNPVFVLSPDHEHVITANLSQAHESERLGENPESAERLLHEVLESIKF